MTRISELPRREWESLASPEFVREITNLYRTPAGTMLLRDVQAVGLAEASKFRGKFLDPNAPLARPGLFFAAGTGLGKTLFSGLAPVALGAQRAVVFVPSKLIEKTKREYDELRLHFRIPEIEVKGYGFLSSEKNANWLLEYRPDALIFDEAHALKTASSMKKAAGCAKRVRRYLHHFPDTYVVAMTGTVAKDSILDYAHIIVWCLGDGAPVPTDRDFQEVWADCLDVRKPQDEFSRPSFKVLWKDLGEVNSLEEAREAYASRLCQTPGVIITEQGYNDVPLIVRATYAPDIPEQNATWEMLRGKWIAPDGWPLGDSKAQIWAMSRDLSRGFYRYHDPWPPEEWMTARTNWVAFVRNCIQAEGSPFDTEYQVRKACEEGVIDSDAYGRWVQIEPSHKIIRKTKWVSKAVVEFVKHDVLRKFGAQAGGIVWTCQIPFARALERATGWRYFGDMGLDSEGKAIETARRDEIVIASITANGTGRNLQQWWQNYVTCPPPGNQTTEQLWARTHRPGQDHHEVLLWNLYACKEDLETFRIAGVEAEFAFRTTKQRYKLLDAAIEHPEYGPGAAWG